MKKQLETIRSKKLPPAAIISHPKTLLFQASPLL